jgi:hypothetical protein
MYAPYIWPSTPFPAAFGDDTLNWRDASPKYFITDSIPPFVLMYADSDMVQIIGGAYYGYVTLPGEVNLAYDDLNSVHPTDSFCVRGDHNSILYDLVYDPTCKQRVATRDFISNIMTGIAVDKTPLSQPQQLFAAPNPFNSSCRFDAPEGSKVEITDISGKLVWNTVAQNEPTLWRPKNLSSGVYFTKISLKSGTVYESKVVYLK